MSKQPWEMTLDEWMQTEIVDIRGYLPGLHQSYDFRLSLDGTEYVQRYGRSRQAISKVDFHQNVIEDAIYRGKTIPDHVVQFYADQDRIWALLLLGQCETVVTPIDEK